MAQKREILFPPFRLDAANQLLWRGDEALPLRPKTFAVLTHLLDRPGQLVTKDEFLDACWPDTGMTYTVLKVCIREIREALGDDPKAPRFIETAHRRGYRFIGRISEDGETEGRRDGETERGEHLSLRPSVPLSLCLFIGDGIGGPRSGAGSTARVVGAGARRPTSGRLH